MPALRFNVQAKVNQVNGEGLSGISVASGDTINNRPYMSSLQVLYHYLSLPCLSFASHKLIMTGDTNIFVVVVTALE